MAHGYPGEMRVCHRCDNRLCVRPGHLFLGTAGDNIRDCVSKGRNVPKGLPGTTNHKAKLTDADVHNIRTRYRTKGNTAASLAIEFGVAPCTIAQVGRLETWRHI